MPQALRVEPAATWRDETHSKRVVVFTTLTGLGGFRTGFLYLVGHELSSGINLQF